MEEKKKINKKFTIILIIVIVIGLIYGGYKIIHSFSHITTDDAQIEANMTPIIPHVSGYIKKVYVTDNQKVKKGDTLFVIEDKDYQVKLEQAKASLVATKSQLVVTKANVGSYLASESASNAQVKLATGNIETAEIKLWRANNDYKRYKNLYHNHSITEQQYEQALAAKKESEKQLQIFKAQKNAAKSQYNAAQSRTEISRKQIDVAQANVKKAQAKLNAANLDSSYTIVTAPIDGQLSNVDIQKGRFVAPGQSLFYLINTKVKWIVANFKETQLNKMRVGQKVSIDVDAFPDYDFEGVIAAISPATGTRFSLLPPDNATGNFVKIIQRLPVKITFTKSNDHEKLQRLRSGMNVYVDIHVE